MIVENVTPDREICEKLDRVILLSTGDWQNAEQASVTFEQFMAQRLPPRNVRLGDTIMGNGNATKVQLSNGRDILDGIVSDHGFDVLTNAIMYPSNSMMGWHTNSDDAGVRTYYTYTDGKAAFRYIDPQTGDEIIDFDNCGWTCRRFNISNSPPYLWHTVWSEGRRFAFGFNTYHRNA